jgi:hypothetical protein
LKASMSPYIGCSTIVKQLVEALCRERSAPTSIPVASRL